MFESGAVKLQMGDVLLDVAAGTPCQFRQEVASINDREGHFVFLGDVSQRVVCSPNVEQLIRWGCPCMGIDDIREHGTWCRLALSAILMAAFSETAVDTLGRNLAHSGLCETACGSSCTTTSGC